jgi:putative peptidoglycan lipid II flippase
MSTRSKVLSIASGTLASRVTGLVRVLVLAWVLGFTPVADAYNLANTVPNMLFDLVLGGVASATFIPVFVERLAIDGDRKAWRSISTIVTLSLLVLLGASALTYLGASPIIHAFTVLRHGASTSSLRQATLAANLLKWFSPQIFFYGVIGISTALLNVRQRFTSAAWAPIINNLVCIAVLIWFHLIDPAPTVDSLHTGHELVWLGLGTTVGVALQFVAMWPSLVRADLGRLRFRLQWRDPGVSAVTRLGAWTLTVVITNQIALYVVLAVAYGQGGNGPVSAYTYGWSFMQMPYAVVVVSVLSALTPQLAALATARDFRALGARLEVGLRQGLIIIIPATVLLMMLAQPLAGVLLNHVNATHHLLVGTVLAILCAGLPGFTIFQTCVRGLQAMQRARDVFILYAIENAINIFLAVALGRHSIAALAASVAIAYSATALIALATLSRYDVSISHVVVDPFVRRSFVASLVGALFIALGYALVTWQHGLGLIVHAGLAVVAGALGYLVTISLWPLQPHRPATPTRRPH